MVLTAIWTVIKAFLPEKTVSKVNFISTTAELLVDIDADQLPKFLGGSCECEGGCLKSNKGPWNDYEIVFPNGIKLKSSQQQEEKKIEEIEHVQNPESEKIEE